MTMEPLPANFDTHGIAGTVANPADLSKLGELRALVEAQMKAGTLQTEQSVSYQANSATPGVTSSQPRTVTANSANAGKDPAAQSQPAAQPKAVEPMPDGGVAKFYNPETGEYNWKAHAVEAEFRVKMAQGKKAKAEAAKPAPSKTEAVKAEAPAEGDAEAQAVVADAGLDWDTLGDKVMMLGDLDEDDYEALEKVGVPRQVVATHVAGIKAIVEQTKQQVYAKAGGEESLKALLTWAKGNLSDQEITAYDEMLASEQWPVALDALMARAGQSKAPRPNLLVPGATSPAGQPVAGYTSQAEILKDISKPEYRTDPAFRRQVEAKLAVTRR